jgi:hypothetical protein
MPEPTPPAAHPDVRYEKSDARGGAIIALGVLLAVMVFIVLGSADMLFDFFKEHEQRKDERLPSLAAKQRVHLPDDRDKIPQPRLQVSEPLDLEKLRREEDALLNGYGWVDREKGTVRIPIDEAMRLLSERNKEAKK